MVFVTQERVEWLKFAHPDSTAFKVGWLAMSAYAQLCATVFLIPIVKTLLRAFDCTKHPDSGLYIFDTLLVDATPTGGSAAGFGSYDGVLDPNIYECWKGEHWWYVGAAITLFAIFMSIAVRLLQVGGDLASLEVRLPNVFDWRGDAKKAQPIEHPLSLKNTSHGAFTATASADALNERSHLTMNGVKTFVDQSDQSRSL